MKPSIFKSFVVLSLIVFAAGCGKEGSKSSGSKQNYYNGGDYFTNPITETSPQQTQQNLAELKKWRALADTNNARHFSVTSNSLSSNSDGSTCQGKIKKFLGIEFCVYSSGYANTKNFLVTPIPDYTRPGYCEVDNYNRCINGYSIYEGKANNAKLAEAFQGTAYAPYLLSVTRTGSNFILSYGSNPVDQRATLMYRIDVAAHSMLNPIEIYDVSSATPEHELITIR